MSEIVLFRSSWLCLHMNSAVSCSAVSGMDEALFRCWSVPPGPLPYLLKVQGNSALSAVIWGQPAADKLSWGSFCRYCDSLISASVY